VLAETESPRERARITGMFQQGEEINRAAHAHGALFATGTATRYDQGLFMAYGMVFAVTTPVGTQQSLPDLSALLGLSAAAVPKNRAVTSVQVPRIGTVARVTGTETTRLAAEIDADLLTMHTLMPLPGQTGEFLVVTLVSPNLALEEDVYGLFDAITRTFRFAPASAEPDQPGRTMRSATTPW
jgi:hypothetical protein